MASQPAKDVRRTAATCQRGDLHGSILSVTRSTDVATLARQWSDALEAWAIPPQILERAERDPWTLPVERFASRADRSIATPQGPSFERAAEALRGARGTVLDVGAGAGAASLPLAPWATHITAVDTKPAMLAAFETRADDLGVDHQVIAGTWPDVAGQVAVHDVTVVHHVVFNVADIVPFATALDEATRRRIVLEIPTHHPLTWMNPLWQTFHGIRRPDGPTAGDLVEILSALQLRDVRAEYWTATAHSTQRLHEADLIAQRLCLPSSRASEVADALETVDRDHRELVTISWTPGA
jgi:2-polyprenyl-3-methyl-5-hydroxy-6-metoxy-1,4-benzoquinol methylase